MAAGIFRLVRLASFVNLRLRAEEGVDSLIRSISDGDGRRPSGFLRLQLDGSNSVCEECAPFPTEPDRAQIEHTPREVLAI